MQYAITYFLEGSHLP